MDSIAVSHAIPTTIDVVHKIPIALSSFSIHPPEYYVPSLERNIRCICITVFASIACISITRNVLYPLITGEPHPAYLKDLERARVKEEHKIRKRERKLELEALEALAPSQDQGSKEQ